MNPESTVVEDCVIQASIPLTTKLYQHTDHSMIPGRFTALSFVVERDTSLRRARDRRTDRQTSRRWLVQGSAQQAVKIKMKNKQYAFCC